MWHDTLQFAGQHPWLAFFLACVLSSVVTAPFKFAFRAYSRSLRARNIAARGWPPEHLDADGDFKPESK